MYHRIKHKIKSSRAIQYTLLLLLIVVIAVIPYPIPHNLKQETIAHVVSMKSCLVSTGVSPTFSECASQLQMKEGDVKKEADEVWAYSRLEKEKGRASIVLSNYSDALIHLQNTSDNEAQLKKDIAFAYMSLKQYNAAVEPCNEVLANDANDTFCLDIAGIADYVSDRNSEAFEKGKKAYEISASPCRSLNLGLYYGGTGNISEAKTRIDEVIRSNKNIVLSCWSPIKSDIPVSAMDRYNLCFLNNDKTKSICRSFAAEGWVEGNVTQKKTPEQIKQEEEQKKRLAELDTSRVL